MQQAHGADNYPCSFRNRLASLYRNTWRHACAKLDTMAGMTRIDPKPTGTSHTRASQMATPALTRKELLERLRIEFPDAGHAVGDFEIEELSRGGCRLRQRYDKRVLRPGGTLSGATMMALGDFAMYLAVLSAIGWGSVAGANNLRNYFLMKCPHGD